jgi:hypothetical protein
MTDYGRDVSATTDLHTGRVSTGPRLVAEAAFRRLITARGSLIDDPNYGLDVRQFIHEGLTPGRIASIPGRIKQEVGKDDRILPESLRVDMRLDGPLTSQVATISVRGLTSDEEPFELVMAVSEITVQLLKAGAP